MPFIYKLVSSHTKKVYVGKTKEKSIEVRFGTHKSNYKRYLRGEYGECRACELLKFLDVKIVKLEECSEQDMVCRERYWIENIPDTCNKVIPGQTKMEYYWNNPDYREKQLKKQKERSKLPETKKKRKEYEEKNREHIKHMTKLNREKHRDSRNERRRNTKATCEFCGFVGLKENLKRHQKTKRCLITRENKINQ